jgi:hypothetical protein
MCVPQTAEGEKRKSASHVINCTVWALSSRVAVYCVGRHSRLITPEPCSAQRGIGSMMPENKVLIIVNAALGPTRS